MPNKPREALRLPSSKSAFSPHSVTTIFRKWTRKGPRVAKRPASYRDPKPRNPKLLEKNSKITPPGPDPKFLENKTQKIVNILKKYSLFEFFSRSLGSGRGG